MDCFALTGTYDLILQSTNWPNASFTLTKGKLQCYHYIGSNTCKLLIEVPFHLELLALPWPVLYKRYNRTGALAWLLSNMGKLQMWAKNVSSKSFSMTGLIHQKFKLGTNLTPLGYLLGHNFLITLPQGAFFSNF